MGGAADNNAVHFGVVLVVNVHFQPLFNIDCPNTQGNEAVLFIPVSLKIIIIKPLDSLVLNIIERFHALFVAGDRVDVGKPGDVTFVDGCDNVKGGPLALG